MGARAARSVGQGALVVDFALYLHALHWSALTIGLLYSASLLVGAVATLLVGPLSDQYGAKGFLLGYEAVQLIAASIALSTAQPVWLTLAAVLGGFGRGANGGAGPFAPAEQSWMSRSVTRGQWGQVFHLNTSIGLLGMAAGATLATLPGILAGVLPGTEAYRLLFLVVLLGSLICLLFLGAAKESTVDTASAVQSEQIQTAPPEVRKPIWRVLLTFGTINALNGLGIGMVGPLMAYWFHLRFGVGPAAIGGAMALAFVSAAVMSLIGLRLIRRFGLVGTVLRMRLLGLALLLALPFAPFFWVAMLLFIARAALNQGSIGSRQALFLGLVGKSQRGLAATVNSLSVQAPRSIGPTITAMFFQAEMLVTPFLVAGALQGAYLYFFQRFFSRAEDHDQTA
ncbi:MFS transporter [Acidithiobacillus sp. 'AMD consortium']|uniref:MFS transporter n=2 Tax=Acidithiobacillus ferridurans TaxID=1232575 RepID=A0A8X8G938_ACIFI|nr:MULTISPECIES: MFS transporter [Acidithiobacillus]MBU2716870.1 MFS transporter [Acidithiobacillus ferridurans]MBU2720010.1 MFS transporter [Acidithiobacillus ferridurans]MBU2722487.1 MFS transporter [Acidithiobacillus ferridurans]MBU2725416.1 MFS transporter [Acidithiobacillus ferridurans]MBU2804586.1 MFS transporter [Acidithiobacillus ferridurans]